MGWEEDVGQTADAPGLGCGEHLLVWTWRKMAAGRSGCPLILREFSRLCGEDSAEVLATLCVFLRALACASRRRLRIGCPGGIGLTDDERQLLTLIAAAQADDQTRFDANLRRLVRADLRHAAVIAARALGTALLVHGLRLPLPAQVLPAVGEGGAAPIHGF